MILLSISLPEQKPLKNLSLKVTTSNTRTRTNLPVHSRILLNFILQKYTAVVQKEIRVDQDLVCSFISPSPEKRALTPQGKCNVFVHNLLENSCVWNLTWGNSLFFFYLLYSPCLMEFKARMEDLNPNKVAFVENWVTFCTV